MSKIALTPEELRHRLVRIGGTVAVAFGILALLGWGLGLPFLASLGWDVIPMAPSTALLFVLYGVAALLRARLPFGRGAHRVGVAINAAGALVALLMLILSFWGIRPAAEHLGFAAVGTVGEAPVGHMSPVTAICFLLASLSFLGSLPSSSSRPWRAAAAWWTAGLLLATSSLLLLAYLFGRPLFYGGSFIPPAATTSIAFAALAATLLALAGRQESTAGPAERVPYPLVLVFVLFAAGIVTAGGLYFRNDGRRYRAGVEHELLTVAELKTNELMLWRSERLSGAPLFLGSTSFSALVQRVFDNPQDTEAGAKLQTFLRKVQTQNLYDRLSVLDARGVERLAVPEGRTPDSSVIARRVPAVLRAGEVTFEDFYRNEHDQRVYLSVLVPILDERSRALGMLAFRIDPDTYLYPLLNRWPTPAQTAETLLVRREGNDVLFLNELKFQKHTALTLRIPLTNQKVAVVKAVLGQEGIVEARDYRGVPVLAALRAVPGSPWFLVARVDTVEVNAPLREGLGVIVLLMGSMLALAAAGMWVFWREQRTRHFRELYDLERERAWLHDVIARSRNEVYVVELDTLRFRFANRGACRNLGYTQEELSRLTVLDIVPGFTEEAVRSRVRPLRTGELPVQVFETAQCRKDGSEYPVEIHLQLVEAGAGPVLLAITNDITERKHAEADLRASEELLRLAQEVAKVGTFERNLPVGETRWTPEAEGLYGLPPGGFPKSVAAFLDLIHGEDRPYVARLLEQSMRTGDGEGEWRVIWPDGTVHWIAGRWRVFKDEKGRPVRMLGMDFDITERKRAEQALRQSEERFRLLVEHIHDALVIDDVAGKVTFANDQFLALFGFKQEQLPHLKLEDYVAPEWREQMRDRHDRRVRGEAAATHFEYEGLRQDGRRLWLEADVVPLLDDTGRVTGTQSAIRDISERKQTQRSMADALRYARRILDTSPVGIVTYKASGETVAANLASAQLIGASMEQVRAQNFRHLESWRQSGLLAAAEEALANGAQRNCEVHTTSMFGKEIWVNAHFVPFTYADEPHLLALFEDINERKQAEQQLLRKTEELEAVFQSLPDLYFRMRRDGTILDYLSDERRKLYAPPEQFFGKRMQSVLPAEVGRQFEKALHELEQSSKPVAFEYGLPADGKVYLFEARLSRLHGDEVVALVRDITERKRAEEALRQAEEKYRRIFEEAVIGLFQTTPDGKYLSVNPELARLYGYDSPAELMASRTDIAHQAYANPSERELFKRQVEEKGSLHNFEYQAYRKDGTKLWWRENARVVRDSSGAVLYYEGTVEDITERKVLEEQLRLAQRLEAVGRLAGGVAHDFNNTLGVIIGYSQLLEDPQGLTEIQNKQVKEIRKAADRAATITRQLLAFSRKQILQPRVLNLNELTAEVSKLLRRLIGEDVELVINAGSDLGRVKADPGQIEQVIMNLAVNARDAMPQGGKLVIETANADLDEGYAAGHPPLQPGRYVMLAVSDTGCGMDAETKAHIFEPFFTTKELGKGTGLGLSIVYGVVKQSNGYIWAYSEPGQGTTFKIYLPRVEESPDTIASRTPELVLPGGAETILLVEDEGSLRTMARVFLESKGYTILEAESGQEALEIAQRHRGQIHLLLTDVIMPGMSGRKLAEAVAASRAGIKLLYMSGYTDELVTQHGILSPGTRLLEKPFTRDSLLRRVRSVLDGGS